MAAISLKFVVLQIEEVLAQVPKAAAAVEDHNEPEASATE